MEYDFPDVNADVFAAMTRENETAPQGASPEGQLVEMVFAEKTNESNCVYNYTRIFKLCQESEIGSILIQRDAIGFETTTSRDDLIISKGWKPCDGTRRRINALIEGERLRGVPIITPPGGSGFCIPSPNRWEVELRAWAKSSLKRGKHTLDPVNAVMHVCIPDNLDGQIEIGAYYAT